MSIVTALLAIATALVLLERFGWPFELLAHFRPHMLALGLVLALLAAAYGYWPLAGFAALLAGLHAWMFPRSLFTTPRPTPGASAGLGVVWANVWNKPSAAAKTLEFAMSRNADIVLLAEYPADQPRQALSIPGYPYFHDSGAGRGQALSGTRVVAFSRLPIEFVRTVRSPEMGDRPVITFRVRLEDGQSLQVIAGHPSPPLTPAGLNQRNALLDRIRDLASPPFVIAGDFNATPWSVGYNRAPGIRIGDPRLEYTWITNFPLLGLPLDHMKVSPGVEVSSYEVAPFTGSDHRALFARVHPGYIRNPHWQPDQFMP